MNRPELIKKLSEAADSTQRDAGIFLDAMLSVFTEALANGETIKLRGFGDFEVRDRKTCTVKNPNTNEEHIVAGHKVCKFTQSPVLRERINEGGI